MNDPLTIIARGFGWSEVPRPKHMSRMFSTPWGIVGNRILIAAYAEAELAKRDIYLPPVHAHDTPLAKAIATLMNITEYLKAQS
jgi:hypothetical protein